VSALIHTATMVTAEVYMIARLSPLYVQSPIALGLVGGIGAVTAVLAASIGMVQTDLKKILAYSTVSQIGYMFIGLGAGAFAAAIFHLMMHAFFKACLFLCAGSVMHALAGELNVFKMGGLRARMPTTAYTFLIAACAISGVPGFASFFSKDLILEEAFLNGHVVTWLLGLIGAAMTSFYIFRAYFLAFTGESRVDGDKEHHLHESPSVMTVPLVILAALSIVGGWIGLPANFLWGNRLTPYLAPSLGHLPHVEDSDPSALTVKLLMLGATAVALTGIYVAYAMYGRRSQAPERLAAEAPGAYRTLWHKYYVDELYDAIAIRPYVALSRWFWQVIDSQIIDGAVNGVGELMRWLGSRLRRLQSGDVQAYALAMLIGAICAVVALLR
jgi:NADH-quinone oxidoreductase subunit L